MSDYAERNRLRHVGRIPQETLDYLTSKRRWDNRLRWWDLPVLLIVAVYLVFLVGLLFRVHKPSVSSDLLRIGVLIAVLANIVRIRVKAMFQ
jgi:hypothetical protein